MTFDTLERSDADGQPVRLYLFERGAETYRYTSAESDISFDSFAWSTHPGGVTDKGVQQIGPSETDQFIVSAAWDFPVAELFQGTPPSGPVYLTVYRVHVGDTEAEVIWKGVVGSMRRASAGVSELLCESLVSTFRGNGARLTWSMGCPHMLYDSNCRVDKAAFAVPFVVDAADGASVSSDTLTTFDPGWFDGGFVEWEVSPGTLERRAVETHSGAVLTTLGQADGIEPGMYLTAYPGCTRDAPTCQGKFNNLVNYGGCPHLPHKSPFTTGNPLTSTASFGSVQSPAQYNPTKST